VEKFSSVSFYPSAGFLWEIDSPFNFSLSVSCLRLSKKSLFLSFLRIFYRPKGRIHFFKKTRVGIMVFLKFWKGGYCPKRNGIEGKKP
jgi:hypothetical protein